MAQLRFQIGVPRAGSAAKDAESARENFRSLRPQAGSAARQAEEARRSEERGIPAGIGGAAIRLRSTAAGVRRMSDGQSNVGQTPHADDLVSGLHVKSQEGAASGPDFPAAIPANSDASGSLPESGQPDMPAKLKSFLRSLFPGAVARNL